MGLINCNVCENKISENAYICPHCGDHIRDREINAIAVKFAQDAIKKNSEAMKSVKYINPFFLTSSIFLIFYMIYNLASDLFSLK